ncbi:MAG: antitoxin family protein [Polyangiaceae bacterium]|nr:antitoxin family protein [Polyangiaceae bacterium]
MKPVEASSEKGLLRPAKPLPLGEGEHVRVIVLRVGIAAAEDIELVEAGLDDWAAGLDSEDAR